MEERNGVRIGQRVRDVEGNDLGRVDALYEQGFSIVKGFPILFRRDLVARYEEVRGERDGALVLARSDRDVFDLAAGGVPPSWTVPTPPGYPPIAAPPEARLLLEDLAAGRIAADLEGAAPEGAGLPTGGSSLAESEGRPAPGASPGGLGHHR
jgi:hypothetical protein